MNDEFDARVRNETWELVPSTSMQNLVGCKWVFGIKRLPDGSTDRYKAEILRYFPPCPWLRPYSQHKLDSHSIPCVFLGYSSTQSAYICLDLSTSKTYISHHVKFLENTFPFTTHQSHLARPTP